MKTEGLGSGQGNPRKNSEYCSLLSALSPLSQTLLSFLLSVSSRLQAGYSHIHYNIASRAPPFVVLCTGDEDGTLVDDILKENLVNQARIDVGGMQF